MLTPEVIAELRRLETLAPEAPWSAEQCRLFGSKGRLLSIVSELYDPDGTDAMNFAVALRNHASDLIAAAERVPLLEQAIKDGCDTDTECRRLAATVLGQEFVYGSPDGVPSLEEVVERLVKNLANSSCCILDGKPRHTTH